MTRSIKDKNEIINRGLFSEIILYNGSKEEKSRAIIDTEFVDIVKDIKWTSSKKGYANGKINNKTVYLSRIIYEAKFMKIKTGMLIDHTNHNTLDNRLNNLRVVTRMQNRWNTNHVGVYFHKNYNKFFASITVNKKRIPVGVYDDFNEALMNRKIAEKKYYGEYCYNVPSKKVELRGMEVDYYNQTN